MRRALLFINLSLLCCFGCVTSHPKIYWHKITTMQLAQNSVSTAIWAGICWMVLLLVSTGLIYCYGYSQLGVNVLSHVTGRWLSICRGKEVSGLGSLHPAGYLDLIHTRGGGVYFQEPQEGKSPCSSLLMSSSSNPPHSQAKLQKVEK